MTMTPADTNHRFFRLQEEDAKMRGRSSRRFRRPHGIVLPLRAAVVVVVSVPEDFYAADIERSITGGEGEEEEMFHSWGGRARY